MNVLLMGLRGSGKTTIGRRLADALGMPFIDLDEQVLATFTEDSVGRVWAAHGEQAWRRAERSALTAVFEGDDRVIALGGGTPMIAQARHDIESHRRAGRVRTIYLRCDPLELARRISLEPGDRPSLTGADVTEEIGDILAAREPTFRELADLEYDVTKTTPPQAVAGLVEQIGGSIRTG